VELKYYKLLKNHRSLQRTPSVTVSLRRRLSTHLLFTVDCSAH